MARCLPDDAMDSCRCYQEPNRGRADKIIEPALLCLILQNNTNTYTHLFSLEKWMIQSFNCRETLLRIHHKQL